MCFSGFNIITMDIALQLYDQIVLHYQNNDVDGLKQTIVSVVEKLQEQNTLVNHMQQACKIMQEKLSAEEEKSTYYSNLAADMSKIVNQKDEEMRRLGVEMEKKTVEINVMSVQMESLQNHNKNLEKTIIMLKKNAAEYDYDSLCKKEVQDLIFQPSFLDIVTKLPTYKMVSALSTLINPPWAHADFPDISTDHCKTKMCNLRDCINCATVFRKLSLIYHSDKVEVNANIITNETERVKWINVCKDIQTMLTVRVNAPSLKRKIAT